VPVFCYLPWRDVDVDLAFAENKAECFARYWLWNQFASTGPKLSVIQYKTFSSRIKKGSPLPLNHLFTR
jgi:hypothetical protein